MYDPFNLFHQKKAPSAILHQPPEIVPEPPTIPALPEVPSSPPPPPADPAAA